MEIPFVGDYQFLLIPAIVFTGLVQLLFSSTLSKYSKINSQNGLTGRAAAERILQLNNITNVPVQPVKGTWSDHYGRGKAQDGTPTQFIGLSEPVFDKTSISAIAVAAHEAGHAIQYDQKYALMTLRNTIRPVSSFGSTIGPWLAGAGVLLGLDVGLGSALLDIGIILFGGAVLFSLLTLPAEINASSRALAILKNNNMLTPSELKGAKKALGAAAMTYFASLLTSCLSMLRLILLRRSRKR